MTDDRLAACLDPARQVMMIGGGAEEVLVELAARRLGVSP